MKQNTQFEVLILPFNEVSKLANVNRRTKAIMGLLAWVKDALVMQPKVSKISSLRRQSLTVEPKILGVVKPSTVRLKANAQAYVSQPLLRDTRYHLGIKTVENSLKGISYRLGISEQSLPSI